MKPLWLVCAMALFMCMSCPAQSSDFAAPQPAIAPFLESEISLSSSGDLLESGDLKDDPGVKLYKEGYNYILGENWSSARKKFAELLEKYPKSKYVDDAQYWSAYALKHSDKKKAIEAYRKFIEEYSKSSYYDDALNDYLELNNGNAAGLNNLTVGEGGQVTVDDHGVRVHRGKAHLGENGVVISSSGEDSPHIATYSFSGRGKGYGYAYSVAPTLRMSEQRMRLAERQVGRQLARLAPMGTPPPTPRAFTMLPPGGEEYDRETRLKMDALYAIGETKEDSISYKTLREVAVDTKQPRVLRETAMDALANFSTFDVLPVFLEVAKRDTSEEIQNMAIDYMGQMSRNKNKSFESLAELFGAIPKSRTTQLQTVLGSIAEIGNDKAVDFLANVARTHEDYDLRSDAVYYLGNIGGDKARTALYEILKGR